MADQAKSLKVFVSYSRADVSFADQLVLALEDKGFEPILDRHDISGAENWRERLGKLILSADAVAFVLTAKSAASDICKWEVEEAVRLGKRVIPITHESISGVTPPKALSELNWIPFYADPATPGSGFYYGVKRLVDALSIDLDWLRAQTRYSERALEWDKGRPEDLLLRGEALKEAEGWLARTPAGSHPPDLIREYLAASGDAEQHRQVAAKAQLEEREQALKTAEAAVADSRRAQQALRRFSLWALVAGVVLLAIAIPGNYFAATRTLDANDRKAALFADASNGLTRQSDYTRALLMALAGDPPAHVGLLEDLMRPNGNVAVRNALARAYASDRAVTSMDVEDASRLVALADGRRFVTVHRSGAVMLWTAGETLAPKALALPRQVADVFPLPDGDRLILEWSPAAGQPFAVWSLSQSKLLNAFGPTLTAEPAAWPQAVSLSVQGDWLAVGDRGKVSIWDTGTGAEIKSTAFDPMGFDAIAASSEQDVVALSSGDNVMIWRPMADKRVGPVEGSFGSVRSLVHWTEDTIIFGSDFGNVGGVDHDAKMTSALQTFAEDIDDPEAVTRLKVSKDERGMLMVSETGQVRLLDLATRKVTEPFGKITGVVDADFLAKAGMLAAMSEQGKVTLVSYGGAAERTPLPTVFGLPGDTPQENLSILPSVDDSLALMHADGSLRVWRPGMAAALRFGVPVQVQNGMSDTGYLFSTASSLLATANGGKIDIWAPEGTAVKTSLTLGSEGDDITDGAFTADGTAFYYRLTSGKAGVRRIDTGEDIFPARAFESQVLFASPDGRRIAEVVENTLVRVYDAGSEKPATFTAGRFVEKVSFSPDGRIAALLEKDGTFELWRPGESRAFQIAAGHSARMFSIDFHPGGELFATTGADFRIVLWRIGERDPVQVFDVPVDASGEGRADRLTARFDADGKALLMATPVGVMRFPISPIIFADVDTQMKMACERIAARGVAGFSNRDYAEYGFMQKVPQNPCVTLGVVKAPAKS